jgi:hypothetical protein
VANIRNKDVWSGGLSSWFSLSFVSLNIKPFVNLVENWSLGGVFLLNPNREVLACLAVKPVHV